jgi:hypothetical protein
MDISEVFEIIPLGRENAISRLKLCNRTGLKDRVMRRYIEKARRIQNEKTGFILSSAHYNGYWLSFDVGELKDFVKEDDSRKNSSDKRNDNIKKYIAEQEGIKLVPVRSHYRKVGKGNLDGQCRIEVG